MNPEGPWPHWLPKSPEHILNGVVCWVECCSINSWNGWSASICCCVVRTVTWLPMWSKMANVYLDGMPSRMCWTENRHVPDWYSQCAACMAPSCVNMAGPAAGGCQGVAQPECRGPCRNSAKRSCLPWISTNGSLWLGERYHNTTTEASALACRRWTQAGWRYLRGRFDALGVRPIGPTWRGYLVLSFRWYQRFDQWLQLFYPPPESLIHAIVASVELIVAVWRKYCHSNATDGRNLWATVS